jgi:hypothetical protein
MFILTCSFFGVSCVIPEIQANINEWSLLKNGESYFLNYKGSKEIAYSNNSLIDAELDRSSIALTKKSDEVVSLVLSYPRDIYSFIFSSEPTPHILSACKQINLSAIDDSQAATIMVLCSKSSVLNNESFTKLNAEQLLSPNNLYLDGKVKVAIENEKAFLFDDDNVHMKNRPYLIKGDVVEVLEYQNSMLKIKYTGKKRDVLGWINFSDIL